MRPLKGLAWGFAVAVLAAGAGPAHAAWNNVFQVCCAHCGSRPAPVLAPAPTVAGYGAGYGAAFGGGYGAGFGAVSGDPCCDPCPQTTCTTRYVQRCYYAPVTTYRTSSYYEPVTTYRTSYYC